MSRILLSTYILKIRDNDKNDQLLSLFNGTDDFLTVFKDYLDTIFENIRAESSANQTTNLHLTLESPPTIDLENRRIYGYFSSGVSGDEYQIRDLETQDNLLDVQRSHAAFRTLFFYLQIPTSQKTGSFILQRKARYGIKTMFKKSINKYIKSQGYQIYTVHINNLLHGEVYRRMIEYGSLKRVDLIKRRIPPTIEQYYSNGGNPNLIPGVLKTSMSSSTGLPSAYRKVVDKLFRDPNRERIELDGIDEEFDEVEFELELNGKKKTFYVASKSRIQPDVDVTSQLDYENGIPTTQSLVKQAEELTQDIINMKPSNVISN